MAAKLVKPDVAVMAIVGDGGFLMNSQVGVALPKSYQIMSILPGMLLLQNACEACMYGGPCALMPRHGQSQEFLLTCHSRCRACAARHLKPPGQSSMQALWSSDRLIRHPHHADCMRCAPHSKDPGTIP